MWDQLIYATRGAVTVRTDDSAWVVPPHRGVWIPADVRYRLEMSGIVALRMLYIRPRRRGGTVTTCAVVNVNPLLRELLLRTVQLGALDRRVPQQKRLISVIFDELKLLAAVPLQLPWPRDPRAAQFAASGSYRGASRRTLERLFREETGMSLGQWTRRHLLLQALRRLAAGDAVKTVALELGYNSPSAFIAMFRRELGQTPTAYLAVH